MKTVYADRGLDWSGYELALTDDASLPTKLQAEVNRYNSAVRKAGASDDDATYVEDPTHADFLEAWRADLVWRILGYFIETDEQPERAS